MHIRGCSRHLEAFPALDQETVGSQTWFKLAVIQLRILGSQAMLTHVGVQAVIGVNGLAKITR